MFKRELTMYEVRKIKRIMRAVFRVVICLALALFGYLVHTGNPVAEDLGLYICGLSMLAATCFADRLFSGR